MCGGWLLSFMAQFEDGGFATVAGSIFSERAGGLGLGTGCKSHAVARRGSFPKGGKFFPSEVEPLRCGPLPGPGSESSSRLGGGEEFGSAVRL